MAKTNLGERIFGTIDRMSDRLRWVALVLILLMASFIGYEVIVRYVFNSPTKWTLETALIIQVLMPMLACGWVLREEGHVMVELLVERLKPRLHHWVFFLTSVIAIVYCGVMAWTSWDMWLGALATGEVTHIMSYPTWPTKLLICIGFCLFGLQFIVRSYKYYHLAKGKTQVLGVNGG